MDFWTLTTGPAMLGMLTASFAATRCRRTYNRVNRQLCDILGVVGQAVGAVTPSQTFAILADIFPPACNPQ